MLADALKGSEFSISLHSWRGWVSLGEHCKFFFSRKYSIDDNKKRVILLKSNWATQDFELLAEIFSLFEFAFEVVLSGLF